VVWVRSATQSHENAWTKPPPPGAAGLAVEFDVRVMMVPGATFAPAVMELELPAAAAVVSVTMALPTAQVVDEVEGVTEASTHVVLDPE
jgi:hypothetical protein